MRAWIAVLAVAVAVTSLTPLNAQPRGGRPGGGRPGGFRAGRPPIFEVDSASIAQLNPIAKLVKERRKLDLTERQSSKLDSVAAALATEVAPFLSRIDSLKATGRGRFQRPPSHEGRMGSDPASEPMTGPLGGLFDAVAQVDLRYQAALQTALRGLGGDQERRAMKLVDKELTKMARYH